MAALTLRERLAAKADDELIDLLRRRDAHQWRPEVFSLAEDILRSRGVVAADACCTSLRAAGFEPVVLNEFMLRQDPTLAPVLDWVQVAVPESQAVEAAEYLAAADGNEP